jgi:multidrug efflux pump subunit AcrB
MAMFDKILNFFLENSRVNYTLFFLIFAMGIYSYINTPKEIFPKFELDMISITGHYQGASAVILDKMAVNDIEDEVSNINGVQDVNSIISSGRFTIILELKKGINKYNLVNKIKDAISNIQNKFPTDMNDVVVRVVELNKSLLDIAISSNKITLDELKSMTEDFKNKIQTIKGISSIDIQGTSDKIYEVIIDEKKLDAYKLNKNAIYSAISGLSFIYPLGKIQALDGYYFISTFNGAKTKKALKNTLIKANNKSIYLSDFATVQKHYEDSNTLFNYNGKNALNIQIKQNEDGNAIDITKDIYTLIEKQQALYPDISFTISNDQSVKIKDRLNIVISNILLGIILISILVWWLINARMALIITLGIPTSFVISAIYFYLWGYSINLISLVGVLLALGIVVDDAIVVSENIQQKIEEGIPPKQASLIGAKEMAKPVTIASLTTLFSFIPALLIGGTLGEVIKLIPLALGALVIASLVESFIFLPIHASHILKNNSKVKSWKTINNIYSKIIHILMRYKKTFLFSFVLIIPFLTFYIAKNSKFQMFDSFDSRTITISVKANVNTKLEDTFVMIKNIQKDILDEKKDEFFIKSIGAVAGFRRDSASNSEAYPYTAQLMIELEKLKESNFIDKYITPYLSFYYDKKNRIREDTSQTISKKMQEFLDKKNYKTKYNLTDISIVQKKTGPIKSDIKIGLIGNHTQDIYKAINKLQDAIGKFDGVVSLSNTATLGAKEIKIKINTYGEMLGFNEQNIGFLLSNMYLSRKVTTTFDNKDMLDIKIKRKRINNLEEFKNLQIQTPDKNFVYLKDIATLQTINAFEKITKDKGEVNLYVFANVNNKIITASEIIDKLQPLLNDIKKNNIKIKLKGENEKKKELARDMISASALALILILLSMLYLFNSFKDTFILMSVIPFSFLGVLFGHLIMGLNISLPSLIGGLGLAGVVINDGIIMMMQLKTAKNLKELLEKASKRFRPIVLTSITTLIGLSSLIFFPTGQSVIFQSMATALGFGLAWGTILNLLYLPVLYSFINKVK